MNIRIFKLGDRILIIGMIVIAALFMAWNTFGASSSQRLTAVITHDSTIIRSIDLNGLNRPENIDLNQEGIHQVIRAENGRIRFLESDCPHETCVKTGWLTKPGDRAVCVPSRVVIKIVGGSSQVDVLAY